MKRIKKTLTLLFLLPGLITTAQQLAFPGAEGYGRFATGGRGNGENGRVVEVTTLEDDVVNPPVGSFRWAFSQGIDIINHPLLGDIKVNRPLTVVFKVGGVINLKSNEKGDGLKVNRSNITIAGQTAPGDGICFRGATVNFSGSKNVIVRYIRSRPGDELGYETSAFRIENGGNFIIDHCSFSWAIEETTHFSSSDNFTVQNCIVSESFYNSIHKKGERGYGTQWGGQYSTYHHNLLAHHNSRMPRINGSNENDIEALVDYRNNVNYNWGHSGAFYGGEWEATNGKGFAKTNVVNNYFIPGPAAPSSSTFARPSLNREGRTLDGYADWYFDGNVMKGNDAKTKDNWLGVDGSEVGGINNIRSEMVAIKSDGALEDYDAYTETAEAAMNTVFENVGATLPKRDVIDSRVIAEAKGEISVVRYPHIANDGQVTPIKGVSSGLIDTQANLVPTNEQDTKTAWDVYTTSTDGYVDTDHDGIPNFWETAHGLNPEDINDGKLITNNGYSYLENYLNNLDVYVSIPEFKREKVFDIYPNPGKGWINIKSDIKIVKIEVFDFVGRQVKVVDSPVGIESFFMPSLQSGMYLVKAIGVNQKHYVRTFVNQ